MGSQTNILAPASIEKRLEQVAQMTAHVIIADDHPLFRSALKTAVPSALPDAHISEAASLGDVVQLLKEGNTSDLLLLDLHMPGMSGFSGLFLLRADYPDLPVVMVSATEDPIVMRKSVEYGAAGFIPKSSTVDSMKDALTTVMAGEVWLPEEASDTSLAPEADDAGRRIASLTPQQLRVLMMLTEGKLNKQIAYELDVSLATVKAHVSAILKKLDCYSRTQAVIMASHLLPDDPAQQPVSEVDDPDA